MQNHSVDLELALLVEAGLAFICNIQLHPLPENIERYVYLFLPW